MKFQRLSFIATLFLFCSCSLNPFKKDNSVYSNNVVETKKILLEINGVSDDLKKNINLLLGVARNNCKTSIKSLKRTRKKTIDEIQRALQAFGFYKADIGISYDVSDECSKVTVNIVPNEAIILESIEIEIEGDAKNESAFISLINDLSYLKGKQLNHSEYENAKISIESLAAELGYFDGALTDTQLIIDIDNYLARAYIKFDSKERYTISEINTEGDTLFLDNEFVQRLIELPGAKKYHSEHIIQIQNRLISSGYFKSVEAIPRINEPIDKIVFVDIRLEEADRHNFQASLGFATDEGVRSRFGYTNRIWNPKGHSLGVSTEISQIEQSLTSFYQIPREFPSNEQLRFYAFVAQRDIDTFESTSALLSINESKRRTLGIIENRALSYSIDDFEVGSETANSSLLIASASWNYRFSDDGLYPRNAFNLSYSIRGATESVLSDTSFFSTTAALNYIRSLPFDSRLITRTDLGSTWVNNFRSLPPAERFFAGGDKSIRGYDFQDLGPVNQFNEVIGGQYLGIFSLELEKYLTPKWGLAIFIDTGNAFGGPGSDIGLRTGVGLGLRWRSPLGPIRVDFAHPIDDDDGLFNLHLRIGPEF